MKTTGFTILGLVITFLIVSVLKIFGVIDWSWISIGAFLWVPVAIYVAIIIFLIIAGSIRNIRRK